MLLGSLPWAEFRGGVFSCVIVIGVLRFFFTFSPPEDSALKQT